MEVVYNDNDFENQNKIRQDATQIKALLLKMLRNEDLKKYIPQEVRMDDIDNGWKGVCPEGARIFKNVRLTPKLCMFTYAKNINGVMIEECRHYLSNRNNKFNGKNNYFNRNDKVQRNNKFNGTNNYFNRNDKFERNKKFGITDYQQQHDKRGNIKKVKHHYGWMAFKKYKEDQLFKDAWIKFKKGKRSKRDLPTHTKNYQDIMSYYKHVENFYEEHFSTDGLDVTINGHLGHWCTGDYPHIRFIFNTAPGAAWIASLLLFNEMFRGVSNRDIDRALGQIPHFFGQVNDDFEKTHDKYRQYEQKADARVQSAV